MLEVGCGMFDMDDKSSEYNSPRSPPTGWSGGTLDIPWTCPIPIEPLQTPVFDQPHLSSPRKATPHFWAHPTGFERPIPVWPSHACRFAWSKHLRAPSNSCSVLPLLMQQLHPLQVLRQRPLQAPRQHAYPILEPFPLSHRDLVLLKIHILHPQPHAFHQPQL
jgi:hypothetical protein